jgi:large subunit ribosomal protein L25
MPAKSKKIKLTVEKRKIAGRKVKVLRREGVLPANIYGKNVKSLAVQLPLKSFLPVYQQAGETGLVELKVESEEKPRPALIHNVQFQPVTDQPIHTDFYQVSLKEKVTTPVPIELIGESPAVKEKVGILIQPLAEVEVEALPTDLPEKIEVDISGLKNVDEAVVVGDVKVGEGVKILTEPQQILVKIEPPAKEEEVAPPPAEEVPPEEAVEEEKPAETVEEKAPEKIKEIPKQET